MEIDRKRLAAVTAAYTGYLVGNFSDMHNYIEEVLGRSVLTHELANPEVMEQIQKASKEEFSMLWGQFLSEDT